MSNKDSVILVAVGDVHPPRQASANEIFDFTRSILKNADITIGQLEGSMSRRPGIFQLHLPIAPGGGRGSPGPIEGAKILSDAGFDIFSFASNHTMDWSEDATLDTIGVMAENNISIIGVGKNIKEARKPAIIDCKGTKIGFLAYCSVVSRGYEAGKNKSGVAPVRIHTAYEQFDWQPGTPPWIFTQAYPDDLSDMVKDIKKLRSNVDILAVSMHWGVHFVPSTIAMYQYEVGHAAIDAGADIIIGHHPHLLKGIEVYKGKVIFFSLGDFAMGNLALNPPKTDAHNRVIGPFGHGSDVWDYPWGWKVDPNYPTYGFPQDCQKRILLKCDIKNKKIQRVAFLPLWITQKGQPEPLAYSDPRNDEVYHYMEWLCKDQKLHNTRFSREGNEIIVQT